MKKFLSVFATIAFMASQTSFAQAMPIGTSPDSQGKKSMLAFMPVQDPDIDPPRIFFSPPSLNLFTDIFFDTDFGAISSVSFDTEAPFIVAAGLASADGNVFNVQVLDLVTFFELLNITLPDGQIAVGIGFFAQALYEGYYDPFFPVCPCGSLNVLAIDFAGNSSSGLAPVIVFSF
jgi:hypothetical protein